MQVLELFILVPICIDVLCAVAGENAQLALVRVDVIKLCIGENDRILRLNFGKAGTAWIDTVPAILFVSLVAS